MEKRRDTRSSDLTCKRASLEHLSLPQVSDQQLLRVFFFFSGSLTIVVLEVSEF